MYKTFAFILYFFYVYGTVPTNTNKIKLWNYKDTVTVTYLGELFFF